MKSAMQNDYSGNRKHWGSSMVKSHRLVLYMYFFVYMMLMSHESVMVSCFQRGVLLMSTSTPRKKNSKNDNIGGAKSSSSRGKRNKSDFIDFKGKKLGMEGAQNLKGLRKVNKLYNGEIQPKDFEPRYMTHAADDSFDEQLTSLNKKSNEMLADLKNVYLKLRVLTEVSELVYMFMYL